VLFRSLLVKYEDLTMEDGKTSQCWYIDYQHFVYVIRFRMYLIQSELDKQETLEYNHLYFECPSCQAHYSELEAVRLLSKDNKFICSHCCPTEDFRGTMSQPRFTLVEVDNRSRLKEIQAMKRKLKEQFYGSDLHDGIYNLLAELKDVPLIRNRPSENIKRGLGASKVTDQDTQLEIAENAKDRGRAKKEVRGTMQSFLGQDMVGGEFRVEMGTTSSLTTVQGGAGGETVPAAKRVKAMPSFLQGSRVTGLGSDMGLDASSPAVESSFTMVAVEVVTEHMGTSLQGVGAASVTAHSVGVVGSNAVSAAATDATDDVDWEDGDAEAEGDGDGDGGRMEAGDGGGAGVGLASSVRAGDKPMLVGNVEDSGDGDGDVAWEDG